MSIPKVPRRSWIQRWHVKGIVVTGLLLILLVTSSRMTGVDVGMFFSNFGQFLNLLVRMSHPDWQYANVIVRPLLETIQMAILGTTIGAAFAVPFAVLSASNLIPCSSQMLINSSVLQTSPGQLHGFCIVF